MLDQESSRLPNKYRIAIVLCDLEGKTPKEAARQLKLPEGTLSTRLRTALAAVLSQQVASAGVPPRWCFRSREINTLGECWGRLARTSPRLEVNQVERSSVQGILLVVKDVFEIKEQYRTGHEPGLVAELDRLVSQDPTLLIGKAALVQMPSGGILRLRIDGARDHGVVNSLFFNRLTTADVPIGSSIEIRDPVQGEGKSFLILELLGQMAPSEIRDLSHEY